MKTVIEVLAPPNTTGGAQDRQQQCNKAHDGILATLTSAFVSNLRNITYTGYEVAFDYRVLTANRKAIPVVIDVPGKIEGELVMHVSGYKELIEVTARFADPKLPSYKVKTLFVAHTSVHERYLKECAAMFQIMFDAYNMHKVSPDFKEPPIAATGAFDFTYLRNCLTPYLRLIFILRGDSKNVRLDACWKRNRTLNDTALSAVIHDFWYGNVEKPRITSLMKDMACQLVERL